MKLHFVTESFPFADASEQTFLAHEVSTIRHLRDAPEEVVLIPGFTKSSWINKPNTKSHEIVNSEMILDGLLKSRTSIRCRKIQVLLLTLKHMFVWLPRHAAPTGVPALGLRARFLSVARWCDQYLVMRHALRIGNLKFLRNDIVCTWWLGGYTFALVEFYSNFPKLRPTITSRAHGGDLFPEQGPQVNQAKTFRGLDLILPSTLAGAAHIHEVGATEEKVKISKLGTRDLLKEDFTTNQPTLEIVPNLQGLTIITISTAAPIKRLGLLEDHLNEVIKHLEFPLSWIHYGEPISRPTSTVDLNKRIEIVNRGWLDQRQMYTELKQLSDSQRVVVLSYSASEGTCLSLVEAACLGLPLIGCNVGGVPEIVTEKTGVLLTPNSTSEELRLSLIKVSDCYASLRLEARKHWENNFAAADNYRNFWNQVLQIHMKRLSTLDGVD